MRWGTKMQYTSPASFFFCDEGIRDLMKKGLRLDVRGPRELPEPADEGIRDLMKKGLRLKVRPVTLDVV
jgi:hypothetical protein